MSAPHARLLPLLLGLTLAAALVGCDSFDDDYGDLAPGTFRFRAGKTTFVGTARFYPNTDRPLAAAAIILTPPNGPEMQFKADAFIGAKRGSRIEPGIQFNPEGSVYDRQSGDVEITRVEAGNIAGRFRFRFKDVSIGPGAGGSITAEGGFNATLVPD